MRKRLTQLLAIAALAFALQTPSAAIARSAGSKQGKAPKLYRTGIVRVQTGAQEPVGIKDEGPKPKPKGPSYGINEDGVQTQGPEGRHWWPGGSGSGGWHGNRGGGSGQNP